MVTFMSIYVYVKLGSSLACLSFTEFNTMHIHFIICSL